MNGNEITLTAIIELAYVVLDKIVVIASIFVFIVRDRRQIEAWWEKLRHDLKGAAGNAYVAAAEAGDDRSMVAAAAAMSGMAQEILEKNREIGAASSALARRYPRRLVEKVAAGFSRLVIAFEGDDFPIPFPDNPERIFLNLFRNAAEAGAKNVRVKSTHREYSALIEVIDDGPGIPREIGAKIFDDGFSTKPGDGQRGIGLFGVRRILEKAGAGIALASPAPSDPADPPGAHFVIEIPLKWTGE